MNEENKSSEIIPFKFPADTGKIIKVIGVGGGGGNAVKHMYREGIHDVAFVLCNTDKQAMDDSDVPVKIVLGPHVTKGLGAGNKPEVALEAARESEEEIRAMLSDGTRMVFITASMGGGTGTGAAPVIAEIARKMNILTVGIVTIPFLFEGYDKISQALDGVGEMSKNVDALLVVNNERLSELYHKKLDKVPLRIALGKADDTLTVAAKSISELITLPGKMNLDFADVNTTLKDGGIALMSAGYGEGENRLAEAIKDALNSPLLSYNDISNAKKILFQISSSSDEKFEICINELDHIKKFMADFEKYIEVIWGTAYNNTLGEKVKFTILASGFGLEEILTQKEKDDISSRKEIDNRKKNKEIETKIKKFYGSHDPSDDLASRIAILTWDEMDDDSFIHLLEEHPTCDRDPQLIGQAREKHAPATASDARQTTTASTGAKPLTIKFA
ncbi:MAG: cell division protein FtsZ [Tannerella sp.]|jgi:cell division protein FtsZ|nr:cell division protein FtsZ [Tannerella sp.]